MGGVVQNTQRTTILRVTLFHVAQSLHQHLHRDVLVVRKEMFLSRISSKVDQRIGVGSDTGETSHDVARRQLT